jgi:hypothetical protein
MSHIRLHDLIRALVNHQKCALSGGSTLFRSAMCICCLPALLCCKFLFVDNRALTGDWQTYQNKSSQFFSVPLEKLNPKIKEFTIVSKFNVLKKFQIRVQSINRPTFYTILKGCVLMQMSLTFWLYSSKLVCKAKILQALLSQFSLLAELLFVKNASQRLR